MKRYVQRLHSYDMFKSYDEALEWLYQQKKTKKREDLSRINELIDFLDLRPRYHVIHIAGTNGKGSTASYLNRLLMLKGYRVGMFVSPYVVCFNERIEVNGEYISNEDVLAYLNELEEVSKSYYEKTKDKVPFFELTFLMALRYFKQKEIDYLVLECGLGGRLDATNALDKVASVITNIGYDHMAQLGNTLEEIALHKLGITRENIPCFTAVDGALLPIFEEYRILHHIPMVYVNQDISHASIQDEGISFSYKNRNYQTSLGGIYQAKNAALALAVIDFLEPSYPFELKLKALRSTFWPGRFERIGPNILIDGAHNLPGIEGLRESLEKGYKGYNIKVIFTALKDKAIKEMLAVLDEVAVEYYFTTILDARCSSPMDFLMLTHKPYKVYLDYKEAIKKAVDALLPTDLLVITGSLHFISEARRVVKEMMKDEL